jgi:hypothetical protein
MAAAVPAPADADDPQDAEDVAHEILMQEIKVGVLGMYNPDYYSEHQGQSVHVSFRAFLSSRVALRVRGKRDRILKHGQRELLLCDRPVGPGGTSWIHMFGGSGSDDYSALAAREFVTRMREYLATRPRRSPQDSCDLVALFDELVRQVSETGEVTTAGVQAAFGIGDTTAGAWLSRLRQIMTGAGDLPRPEPRVVGGITLTLADVRRAIDILKAARGIMVRQPLASAGHPLANAAKGWYHQFAAEELALFPELRIDPQTHVKPAGHVKLAVLHRFERMLGIGMAEEPAPAEPPAAAAGPEPPVTPWDELEAELWAAGLDAGRVDRCLGLARQAASA